MEQTRTHKVLVVDDQEKNRKLMGVILAEKGYDFETAVNGREAIEKAEKYLPDIIFLDIMMPEMDGFETCRRLKEDPGTKHIPIVMVTALADREAMIKGLEAGASDFLTKPVYGTELLVRTKNLVKAKAYEDSLKDFNRLLSDEVDKKTRQVREGYLDTIHRLSIVAEYKDENTSAHIGRVGEYCALIAEQLGWPAKEVETIRHAAPMHDIGKVGIPSDILLKPGPLVTEEFNLMKIHTTIGVRILKGAVSEYLKMAERIALTHHERYSGGGYLQGLREDEIPLEGRIMNIADQYDSLRSVRPYKPAFDHEKTVKVITEGDGRTLPEHFDPEVLEMFDGNHEKFGEIFDRMKD